jgi:hypothetical protein
MAESGLACMRFKQASERAPVALLSSPIQSSREIAAQHSGGKDGLLRGVANKHLPGQFEPAISPALKPAILQGCEKHSFPTTHRPRICHQHGRGRTRLSILPRPLGHPPTATSASSGICSRSSYPPKQTAQMQPVQQTRVRHHSSTTRMSAATLNSTGRRLMTICHVLSDRIRRSELHNTSSTITTSAHRSLTVPTEA